MNIPNKVYAISSKNNFDLEKDKDELNKRNIQYKNAESQNIIIINDKYFWTINGKWKPIGKTQWYGSKGICDFLDRFY